MARLVGYWHTVGLVLIGRLAQEANQPVRHRAAQAFRWVTIVIAMVGWLLVGACVAVGLAGGGRSSSAAGAVGIVLLAMQLPGTAMMTGLVSWFFCPRGLDVEDQNRAIALSYYTAAPLALLPAVAALAWLGAAVLGMTVKISVSIPILTELSGASFFGNHAFEIGGTSGMAVAVLGVLLPALALWWLVLALAAARKVAERKDAGLWVMGLALPVLWALTWAFTTIGLPALMGMFLVMAHSRAG